MATLHSLSCSDKPSSEYEAGGKIARLPAFKTGSSQARLWGKAWAAFHMLAPQPLWKNYNPSAVIPVFGEYMQSKMLLVPGT
jgi:hypothetical protein